MKKIIVSALILFLSSCSFGGGTSGTGISGYDRGSGKLNLLEYKMLGKIIDQKGLPLAQAEVTIDSGSFHKSVRTDKNGTFNLNVGLESGLPVDFSVKKGNFRSSCQSYVSPAGEDQVNLAFVVRGGTLVCP